MNIKTKLISNLLPCFALLGLSSLAPLMGYAQETSSQNTQIPTPPQSRPGMSSYQPVSYDNTMTTTQSDTITTKKGDGLPGSTPSQSPARPYNGPSINIPGTGIRAYFNAPVQPPYNASASYDTFAGQPGGNRDAILQQNKAH